jgi:hypothetical protein
VAGIAALAPEEVSRITARITEDDGSVRTWEAPTEAFLQFQRRPAQLHEAQETIEMMRVMSSVRLDAEPILGEDAWAGAAMLVLNTTSTLPLSERIRRLREIRELATAAGQQGVADTLATILQSLRQGQGPTNVAPAAFVRQPPSR